MSLFGKILPRFDIEAGGHSFDDPTLYGRIWRSTVVLTLVVALLPPLFMTGLNYYLFRKNIRSAVRYDISRNLSSTARTLHFVTQERLAALKLLVRENRREDLDDRAQLDQAFNNLRLAFGGFVDLGLVDGHGIQRSYVGPYDLAGINYAEEGWFREVVVRGVYVSDVFLGYRRFPHFVIAIKRETEPGEFYVLRATVDMSLLNRQISLLGMAHADDAFIINRKGVLQTDSRFHGEILQPITGPVPPYSPDPTVIDDYDERGGKNVLGYAYIEETPFVLMIVKTPFDVGREWLRSQAELFAFLALSVLGIITVVLWSATALVRRIIAADAQRMRVMHKAEYTNKMATIGRLAASVAHEINNPLAVINEKAGLLGDLTVSDHELKHRDRIAGCVSSILNSVDRCSAVTHRLLGFTRRMEIRKVDLMLAEVADEVLGFLGNEASHRNVSVVKHYAEGLGPVSADRGQLQQILLNILSNAFAAIPDGGRVEIILRQAGRGWQEASIHDNGKGISAEDRQHVFEPFFSTKGEFGTGLGLSITYELVQRLGGRIEVESEVGEGTCFSVFLPERDPLAGEQQ